MPKVKVLNKNIELEVPEGANLRKEALRADVEIYPGMTRYLNCLGNSLCGSCAVHVKSGMENCSPVGIREKIRLMFSYLTIGREGQIRLACQTRVLGDVELDTEPSIKM